MLNLQLVRSIVKTEVLTNENAKIFKSYQYRLQDIKGLSAPQLMSKIRTSLGEDTKANLALYTAEWEKLLTDLDDFYRLGIEDNAQFKILIKNSKSLFFKMFNKNAVEFHSLYTKTKVSVLPEPQSILDYLKTFFKFSKRGEGVQEKLSVNTIFDLACEVHGNVDYIKWYLETKPSTFEVDCLVAQLVRGFNYEQFMLKYPFLCQHILQNGVQSPLSFSFLFNKFLLFREKATAEQLDLLGHINTAWGQRYDKISFEKLQLFFKKENIGKWKMYQTSQERLDSLIWHSVCLEGPDISLIRITKNKIGIVSSVYTKYILPSCFIGFFSVGVLYNYELFLDFIINNGSEFSFLKDTELRELFKKIIKIKLSSTPNHIHSVSDVVRVVINFFLYETGLLEPEPEKWGQAFIDNKLMLEERYCQPKASTSYYSLIKDWLYVPNPTGEGVQLSPAAKSWLFIAGIAVSGFVIIYAQSFFVPK